MPVYTATANDALEDNYVILQREDPKTYPTHLPLRFDAVRGLIPVENEILALQKGRIVSKQYSQTFACPIGLNILDPVYVDGDGSVALALATNFSTSKVIGFVRSKPTTTSCLLAHYIYLDGFSSLTPGLNIYLSNTGGFQSSPAYEPKQVGTIITSTSVLLQADPLSAQQVFSNAAVRLFNYANFM